MVTVESLNATRDKVVLALLRHHRSTVQRVLRKDGVCWIETFALNATYSGTVPIRARVVRTWSSSS